ncbi:MAG: outer membrane protein transport protein [Nevskiales bacterium]|nr:outer membrane protein transport protein [Nevskiales bacterium]
MTTEKKQVGNVWLGILILVCCNPVQASGYAVFTHGAGALGEGLANTAHGSTPAVIFYNPALISRLEGTQVENGVTFIAPLHDFHSALGSPSAGTEHEVFFPGTFYLTHQHSEKISLGVGLFSPFGLGTEWPADWEGRYITTRSELLTVNLNPVISFELTPSTAFAVGLDFLLAEASLENKLNLSTLAQPDGNQKFSGHGFGLGFNLGFYSEWTPTVAFGASYRSEVGMDIDGDAEFELPDASLASIFPNTGASTDITFPQQLHVALAYSGIDRTTLEVGLRWEDWSSFNELRIELEQPVAGMSTSISPRDWHDTLTLTTGGRYRLNDRVALLAGFVWGEDPIPDETFDPTITDSNHYALTFGTEIGIHKHRLSLAYSFQKWADRTKNNEIGSVSGARANGKYESSSHFLALGFTYVF